MKPLPFTFRRYSTGERLTVTDMATFPFVRQCVSIKTGFMHYSLQYTRLIRWFDTRLSSDIFQVWMNA
ncbi:hypothetical protein [Nitrosomonas sp. Nm51]|uniref:hypothetical protein n=1 Tax=Nitrosomonas sp. Nm51 TaxID=133720 RepID=UPI00115FF088|nr:hypothetical protein [Nitrosomonas sp. Nm51]